MTLRKVGLIVILLVSCARYSEAQAATATFNAPNNAPTIAVAHGLTYNLYVNSTPTVPGTPVVLTSVVCTGSVPFACTANVPAGVPIIIGTKYELEAKDGVSGAVGPKSVPFISAPGVVTNGRIQ